MQISNLPPTPFGHGSRPDHAGGASRQSDKFQPASAAADPTDAATTPAAAEQTGATDIPGKSVAHRARQHLAELTGLGGHNFGWLVSQIARGTFDIAAYTTDTDGDSGDGGDSVTEAGATAPADETGATSAETSSEEPAEAAVANLLDALEEGDTQTPSATENIVDPVVDLVDELLPDGDREPETA